MHNINNNILALQNVICIKCFNNANCNRVSKVVKQEKNNRKTVREWSRTTNNIGYKFKKIQPTKMELPSTIKQKSNKEQMKLKITNIFEIIVMRWCK